MSARVPSLCCRPRLFHQFPPSKNFAHDRALPRLHELSTKASRCWTAGLLQLNCVPLFVAVFGNVVVEPTLNPLAWVSRLRECHDGSDGKRRDSGLLNWSILGKTLPCRRYRKRGHIVGRHTQTMEAPISMILHMATGAREYVGSKSVDSFVSIFCRRTRAEARSELYLIQRKTPRIFDVRSLQNSNQKSRCHSDLLCSRYLECLDLVDWNNNDDTV